MRSKGTAVYLVALMLLPSASVVWIGVSQTESSLGTVRTSEASVRTTSIVDVPEWRINDNWMYDGYLDVADFVAGSGVSTNVQTLEGSLEVTVIDMYLMDIENDSTLVYEVESIGEYESDGPISIDGTNGCLYIDMDTTEIILASDLSTHTQEAVIDVYFDPVIFGSCWSSFRQEIGLLTVLNTYNPPLENYDFPISVGESWEMDYNQDMEFSGSSNYVTIPSDASDSNTTSWAVVSQGNSGVSYPGCYPSYNITNYDRDGDEVGYNWYCPAIRGNIKSSYVQSLGFIAVHELVSYQGVQRGKEISIDVEYPLSPTDIEISAWINVTNQGQPISNQTLQFRYESDQFFQNITTDEYGSYRLDFNSGQLPDDTVGSDELGSHGLIAWIQSEDLLGTKSLVIDSDIHEIDLVTRSGGVTVQRLRGTNTLTLDSTIGFTAVTGDTLTFSVPILNRGLLTSPSSSLVIQAPDGSTVYGDVPPLNSLEESRVELYWTVPESQSFGNVYFDFEVDPNEEITEDGNRSNNEGSFALYIGALPIADLVVAEESLTLDAVTLDGSASLDPDGGVLECEFSVEKSDGQMEVVVEDDCVFEWSWANDGEYSVSLAISDDENDNSASHTSIIIHNRPPEITLGADAEEVVVTTPITFRVTNRSDADTQNPSAPIDLLWSSTCQEGQVGLACTVIPMVEGTYTIGLLATDDDGATTQVQYSVSVSNSAPTDPVAEVWIEPNRLVTDSRGVYIVQEGDVITLMGQADDSSNDLDTLMHIWRPDAENHPEFNHTSIGRTSITNHTYNASGMHLATLQVFDDDGASTEMLIVPIEVQNIPPSIYPISSPDAIEEDEQLSVDISASDTANDILGLAYCFDLQPTVDADSDGDPKNDCDVPSQHLIHSWPDANTAPNYIIFHVTDDDGDQDSIEIPIEVINVPPTASVSVDSFATPTEGDTVVLSANGTVDSELDMDSLEFHWDIDITVDSDGDGDPANDVDYTGMWIEFTYSSGGLKTAKLTVKDESESHSVMMDIDVAEAPFSLAASIKSNLALLALVSLTLVGAAVWARRFFATDVKEGEELPVRPLDFDAAFDTIEPPVAVQSKEAFAPPPEPAMDPIQEGDITGLDDIIEELTGMQPSPSEPGSPPTERDSLNEVLDLKDIEALFEE